ncbi:MULTISPECIES: alpha/beta fold hydrolase [Acinetobacter]|uniref:Alpha/beta hydrolase n=1 Tax=Acinetobacter junii TaxID=40215 RepID=A0A365PEN3_ACIJU|nr:MULTISPECIES: alpha/beta hydrolase [Acinetobacter]RBA30603.1 alpha/beta hydrolase [Acinetobacter junii]RBA37800.1 alpha/beta hydrolase [Acinetobacter junii]RBA42114.1 alpha/beta hydrolase [Acinetobacter junii]WLF73420.1 alpha/beta hydrolase [Acinetobacter junii]
MNNLVFLPGASGNTQFWYPLIAQLPKTYTKQVIAYSSFHGVAAHPDINSFDDLSDYVVEQIQQPSILIAQSMGGIFAIKAALEKNSLIKGLILIATSGGVNLDQFQVQDWREFYQQEYIEYPDWFVTTKVDYEAFLPNINVETLLIWGDQDPISPVEVGKYLNHLIEKSDLYIVEGGDHQLAEKCANEVALQINIFLETI